MTLRFLPDLRRLRTTRCQKGPWSDVLLLLLSLSPWADVETAVKRHVGLETLPDTHGVEMEGEGE